MNNNKYNIENNVFNVIKLEKTNGIECFGFSDRCIKLYGIFIYNKLTGKTKFINKFNNIDDANNTMELIKMNPSKYVDEDGEYKVEIKLIFEAGPCGYDCILPVMNSNVFEKRTSLVL